MFLPYHRRQNNGASQSRTEIPETMSKINYSSFKLFLSSICHSNEKLIHKFKVPVLGSLRLRPQGDGVVSGDGSSLLLSSLGGRQYQDRGILCPHTAEENEFASSSPFVRALLPPLRAVPSQLNHLLKDPLLNTVTLVIKCQHEFWKGHHDLNHSSMCLYTHMYTHTHCFSWCIYNLSLSVDLITIYCIDVQ
jgi:hypothetical protein